MFPTPYVELNQILRDLVSNMQDTLGKNFVGAYLQGSFAVGDFDLHLDPAWSDLIDGSWAGRPNPALKVRQPADPQDFEKTLEFVKYVMNESSLYMTRR